MQLFYCPNLSGHIATLDSEESHHAIRVLRKKIGDELIVTDGVGNIFSTIIIDANDKHCTFEIQQVLVNTTARNYRIQLALAPTKNPSRMEWLVEKAVEMGIDDIVLLQCQHSERVFLKTDRLNKVALSAMKQSLHATLPTISEIVPFDKWLQDLSSWGDSLRLIAHCEGPRTPLAQHFQKGRDTIILIGPEGDFSQSEIQSACANGFLPVSLGNSRLRTETAALYSIALINALNDAAI